MPISEELLQRIIDNDPTLTSLNLGFNQIVCAEVKFLAAALVTNTTLTSLDLTGNSIKPEVAKDLVATNNNIFFKDAGNPNDDTEHEGVDNFNSGDIKSESTQITSEIKYESKLSETLRTSREAEVVMTSGDVTNPNYDTAEELGAPNTTTKQQSTNNLKKPPESCCVISQYF